MGRLVADGILIGELKGGDIGADEVIEDGERWGTILTAGGKE